MNLPPAASTNQPARRAITIRLAKRASLALRGLLLLFSASILGGAENAESTPLGTNPVGWRGDGSGRYPEANPPIHWGQTATSLEQLRSQATKPNANDLGQPI